MTYNDKIHKYNLTGANLELIADRIASITPGGKSKKEGLGYKVTCPCHEDNNPSLSVYPKNDDPTTLMLWCFACRQNKTPDRIIYDTVRPYISDFEIETTQQQQQQNKKGYFIGQTIAKKGTIKNIYDYKDEQGKTLYQKIRLDNEGKKGFFISPSNYPKENKVLFNLPNIINTFLKSPQPFTRTELKETMTPNLTQFKQWTYWKKVWDDKIRKFKKVPCNELGITISWQKDTWNDTFPLNFSELKDLTSNEIYKGFFLTENDPFIFLDWDHCIPKGFVPNEWTIHLGNWLNISLDDIKNCYFEISQSGEGVHCILELKDPSLKANLSNINNELKAPFEVYVKDRFIALTFNAIKPKVFVDCLSPRIFICEGEKDVLTLEKKGALATTKGSTNDTWLEKYSRVLRGFSCYILADNDKAGVISAFTIANTLYKHNKEFCLNIPNIKVITFDELEPKQDVTDYLEKHSIKELIQKIKATKDFEYIESDVAISEDLFQIENKPPKRFELDTRGNAERLAYYSNGLLKNITDKEDTVVLFNTKKGVWEKNKSAVRAFAQTILKKIPEETIFYSDSREQRALFNFSRASQKPSVAIDAIKTINCIKGVNIESDKFDEHPKLSGKYLLNCLNGTVDLTTGKLYPWDKNDYLTQQAPINYSPNSDYSLWTKCLKDIFSDYPELVEWVQYYIGYIATGNPKEKSFCFLYGDAGNTGKSTVLEAIKHCLGHDYSGVMPFQEFLVASHSNEGGPTPYLAMNSTRRLVTISETATTTNKRAKLNFEKLKSYAGNEVLTARPLYEPAFEFLPKFTFLMALNNKPEITDFQDGTWNRMFLLPFEHVFSGSEKDPDMNTKLYNIKDAIGTWIVQGAVKYFKEGLPENTISNKLVNEYRREENPIFEWLQDCFNFTRNKEDKLPYKEIVTLYKELYPNLKNNSWDLRNLSPILKTECVKVTNNYAYGITKNEEAIQKLREEKEDKDKEFLEEVINI